MKQNKSSTSSDSMIPLTLQFDKSQYVAFRKLLFKEGIWPHEYLKYALASLVYSNANAHGLLRNLKEQKATHMLKEKGGVSKLEINVENIYDLIEMSFTDNQFGSGSMQGINTNNNTMSDEEDEDGE